MATDYKVSRKQFLKQVSWLVALPYLLIAWLMIRKHQLVSETQEIELAIPELEGVYFHDDLILIKKGGTISILSAKCTHLGCRINNLTDGKLLCPCHGSSFMLSGDVVAGPATRGLKELEYNLDPETKKIIITM